MFSAWSSSGVTGGSAARNEWRLQAQDAGSGGAGRAAVILYIEDNAANFELVRHVLNQRPHVRLFAATRGELGLELARLQRPDLILLDLHLPDIPGHEVLRQLRDIPETRDIPVVVISADASASQVDRLIKAGARAYLTKPLDVKQFLTLIDQMLRETEGEGAGG
jgi:CheY-like chemotaxis protein